MLLQVSTAAVAIAAAWLFLFVQSLISKRKKLAGLPHPPMKSLLVGHLHIADECRKLFPKGIHSHVWPDYIRVKYNQPETFYVDWRPFGPLLLLTADPEFVESHVLAKQNLPKSPLETGYMDVFLGKNNMVSLEGARHKSIRSLFNPGFSASNIMTYTDTIVEATLRFTEALTKKAKTNEHFSMEEYATRLTIDVIGMAVFDMDMQAQTKLHPIVKHFRQRTPMMPGSDSVFPWQDVSITRPFRLWVNNRKLEAAINEELNQKIRRRAKDLQDEAQGIAKLKKKSIIDLALNAYEKEMAMSDMAADAVKRITDSNALPQSLRTDLIDSIKTFFFAGHDTTSSTLAWCYYLLHRNPSVQANLTAELNEFFPPGTSTADRIKSEPYIINKLQYTNAVIKETLRIFPPASTLRAASSLGPVQYTTFTDPKTGIEFPFEDVHIWPVIHLIGRNKRFFPEPTKFVPERFIQSRTPFPDSELFTPAGKYAWQPFSIGPRNCIGQELAMIESRIALALTAREFDFVLEYLGEKADPQEPIPDNTVAELSEETEYGRGIREGRIDPNIVEGHRVWPTLAGTAKPNGGCPGRVYLRQTS